MCSRQKKTTRALKEEEQASGSIHWKVKCDGADAMCLPFGIHVKTKNFFCSLILCKSKKTEPEPEELGEEAEDL